MRVLIYTFFGKDRVTRGGGQRVVAAVAVASDEKNKEHIT